MVDVLADSPPPSRLFHEDLNNFVSPRSVPPVPLLLFSDPKHDLLPPRPSLLVIALSRSAHHFFHGLSSKTQIGALFLPEISYSGSSIDPSLLDKSCAIYAFNAPNKSTLLALVQCDVGAERFNAVAKLLIGEQIAPKKVLIIESVQSWSFHGKLTLDEAYAFKLETSAERRVGEGHFSYLEYFPSGGMLDGLAAAMLTRCQMRNTRGMIVVLWPGNCIALTSLLELILNRGGLLYFGMGFNEGHDRHLRRRDFGGHTIAPELYS